MGRQLAMDQFRAVVSTSGVAAAAQKAYYEKKLDEPKLRDGDRRTAQLQIDGLTAALDEADRCRRCGRPLKNTLARQRHYGHDCWKIIGGAR